MQQAVQGKAAADELSKANAAVTDQLSRFINISVEAYPDLKSSANFRALQDELTETENRLGVSRRDYNESVQQYNTYIRRFPAAITAKVTGAQRREPFEAPAGSTAAPQVQFPSDMGIAYGVIVTVVSPGSVLLLGMMGMVEIRGINGIELGRSSPCRIQFR